MIQKITDLLTTHFYIFFIVGVVVIGFLAIGSALRKTKCAIAPLILAVISIAGFVFAVYNRYKYAGKLELYIGVFFVVAFLFNLIIYVIVLVKNERFYSIIKSSSYIESSILVYLNDSGKVVYYTNDFLELFGINKASELSGAINYVHQGEKQYSLNTFISLLGDDKEDDYNIVIDLSNSKELKLALSKRKIIHNGKLLGYVIVNQKTKTAATETNSASELNSLNLVSEAMAVYESDKGKFVLNKKMQAMLGVEEVNNFDDYVFFDDRKQLEKRAKADGEKSKIFYRIEAGNSRFWFQETIRVQSEKLVKVIKETDFKSMVYNFRDYSRLVAELDQLLMTTNNFALIYISIDSLNQIKEKIGKDPTKVLATQFFGNLNNDIKDLKVFEIGYYKYAFFVKNDEVYNNILRDLHNNNSGLLKTKLGFNDMSFDIKSYLGLVERRNVGNATSDVMMNLAEEALKLASNKNYNKDYSIYFSKKKQIEADVKNIDLSDDFLDKILK